jgi:tRNA(Ile2) C34 agmatinyltransferase TiaS
MDFGDPFCMFNPEGALVILAMSQLIDGECPECGGELEKVDENTYVCQSCGARFRGE